MVFISLAGSRVGRDYFEINLKLVGICLKKDLKL